MYMQVLKSKIVAASAVETQLGALFLTPHDSATMRQVLQEIDHPQPPTLMYLH